MGNGWTRHWNLEESKPATVDELTGIDFPMVSGILRKYEGYGHTTGEALLDLIDVCEKFGLPIPQKVNDIYICGTIKVHYFFKTRVRLNPIFFRRQNGRCIAYVYHK